MERRLLACVLSMVALFFPLLAVKTLPEELSLGVLPRFRGIGGRIAGFVLSKLAVSLLLTLPTLALILLTFPTGHPAAVLVLSLILLLGAFGVLLGLSVGLMMLKSATTGGTELLARLLKYKLHGLSIGRLCMIIDVLVVLAYAVAFGNLNNALYGIIAMYICSLAMDMVVYGQTNAKMAYIISDRSQEITQWLLDRDMGVTLLQGRGAFTGDEKKVVLCAFKRSQIVPIKAAVTQIDPNAFIIVCEAHEVLGEGFGEYTPDSL